MFKSKLYIKSKFNIKPNKKIVYSILILFSTLLSIYAYAETDKDTQNTFKIETDLTILSIANNEDTSKNVNQESSINNIINTKAIFQPIPKKDELAEIIISTNNNQFSEISSTIDLNNSNNKEQNAIMNKEDKNKITNESESEPKSIAQNLSKTLSIVKNSLQKGVSSWYGKQFHGRKTASGEKFNMFSYTAAHRTLPFGTYVKVTNPKNNKTAIVKINDRGPYAHSRIIDLSFGAAKDLDIISHGQATVNIEVIQKK